MPFLVFDEIEKETVTPKYSTAYGELVTGEFIEDFARKLERLVDQAATLPLRPLP